MDLQSYRTQLRQGLHQYLMMMYESYRPEIGEEKAKQEVLKCIEEMYTYFNSGGVTGNQVFEFIQMRIDDLTYKMNSAQDYDEQMYYGERVSTLENALEILKEGEEH